MDVSRTVYPLGRHLREKRMELSLSQVQVADGICELTKYQELERNEVYPSDIELAYLCKRLALHFFTMDTAIRMHKLLSKTLRELERRDQELARQVRENVENEQEMFSLTEDIIQSITELKKPCVIFQ